MVDRKQMYLESKRSVVDLVNETNQYAAVPACPGWSVRDVVAHQVGVFQDMMNGNTEGGGSDAWAAAQIERFRDVDLKEMYRTWDQTIDDAGEAADEILEIIVPDLIVHEYDVRGALDDRRNRDSPALIETARNFLYFQEETFRESGMPAVRFVIDSEEAVIGDGEVGNTVETIAFEVTRLIFGRRSASQICALNWSSDPTPWFEALLIMPPRVSDLVE